MEQTKEVGLSGNAYGLYWIRTPTALTELQRDIPQSGIIFLNISTASYIINKWQKWQNKHFEFDLYEIPVGKLRLNWNKRSPNLTHSQN
jgi:hypothetical protein